jgi:hypothetical protein
MANMPYNTRRKSLSLPSLGIHLPVTHASRAAARSPPSTTPNSEQPPSKKLKRENGSELPLSMSPPKRESSPKAIKYENTPPPSPDANHDEEESVESKREIDMDSINDDIVEGVISQLIKSDNRPHLVKELAAILTTFVKIVETSVFLDRVI